MVYKELAKKILNSNVMRYPRTKYVLPNLRDNQYPERKINFYFLSTGRVGTRFFSKVFGSATNATIFHQPEPSLKESVVRDVVSKYMVDKKQFQRVNIGDYSVLEEKILQQMQYPAEVYGDTLNHMFPFGFMLYKYLGPERLRLVHLIRDPVSCGRSILKSERDDTGKGRFKELRPPEFIQGSNPAEKSANIWNGVNEMIRYQFDLINDPKVCKVVRLEDMSIELIEELFEFLGLKGFDKEKAKELMNDKSHDVRHSHLTVNPERIDATQDELSVIERMCSSLSKKYGYGGE